MHHVFDRGNVGQAIFRDDRDRQEFTRRLIKYRDQAGMTLLAHCLETTHFHLVPQTGQTTLSAFMHDLLTSYTRYFNDRWLTRGHLFQGRFGGRRCTSDADVRNAIRYVHLNPVQDGLVQDTGQWPWSSHRGYLDGYDAVAHVEKGLQWFGGRAEYLAFMAEPRYRDDRPTLDELALAAGPASELAALRGPGRGREICEKRRELILAARRHGYRNSDLAKYLSRSTAYISMVAGRFG